jgi:hypothetical protein
MRLLEAANVEESGGNWGLGWNEQDRHCGLHVYLGDVCVPEDTSTDVIGSAASESESYRVSPFSVSARLTRSWMCALPDDERWLGAAVLEATEMAVGRALVTEAVDGSVNWIGAPGVPAVGGTPADVAVGRQRWFEANGGRGDPLLHVGIKNLPGLAKEFIVMRDNGELVSIWGDPVVVSPGYGDLPLAFWTGPVEIRLSPVDVAEEFAARHNLGVVLGARFAAVNLSPCMMVRVGTVPAPALLQARAAEQPKLERVSSPA